VYPAMKISLGEEELTNTDHYLVVAKVREILSK
jgi:hypothetical protein